MCNSLSYLQHCERVTEHHEYTVDQKCHQEERTENSVDVKGNSNPDYTLDIECSQ